MICSKCKKRPAIIFIQKLEGNETVNEGLCWSCAKELGLPQLSSMMESMGISDDDVEQMSNQLMEMTDGDAFELGGAETMPTFLQSLFGDKMSPAEQKDSPSSNKEKKTKEADKPNKKRKFLDSYCTNLCEKAKEGKLDNIIGRDNEIYRVVQILSRRTKNNPCLIGEPGVGKTAIAEGIAQRIVAGEVPFRLLDKEIYLLDLTALVAGTQFRGQFESRVKGLIDEVKSDGNIILFIDEVHTLVGTGDSEGSMSAANIMKPALSRGEIQVIGATTFTEYRKNIEKDSALERRFQPVTINEPSIEDTLAVLRGIKHYYELHHKVKVSDEIIKLSALWSERYINDRFLPDKAIDLLDEACACASLKNKDLTNYAKLNKQLKALTDEESKLEEQNDNPDFERIATVKGELIKVREQLKEIEPKINNIQVTIEDLAKVIELCTGIPSSKIEQNDYVKIMNLDKELKKRIIGQDEAVDSVSLAIKRNRMQLSAKKRPASFIFVGPTGVGKTELVKALSETLFDSVDPIIRLDMSEFMEKHAVSRLIGSPPGYVGYDDAGQLTEKVRRKPYSVILFDEIEKAHPDVMNVLLQILDEGHVTDAHGRNVNFENTVIVMTSNAGSSDKSGIVGFNKGANEIAKEKAMKALSEFLRPEFLGRVDEVIVFNQLKPENLEEIACLLFNELKAALLEKHINLCYDINAAKMVAKLANGGKYNARDIRKVIRKEVEDRIAQCLIDNYDKKVEAIAITAEDNIIVTCL
ncbi:AAA family ATPase [Paludicola sp. MB14-C6]|uniref:ATP-dependent Clp protease ATP-binding subunit n=1 Tax=Paludihabitans sp. MB14-C6 TaxID=3070656 RepID=UPI0027DC757A|nr:ATP-dependent Clp protease ATP-binding subunit [Paludicola sp. MB14-C6]WMJ23301.1 AAA family ATPase [Paludicola sp. MB14-C6]